MTSHRSSSGRHWPGPIITVWLSSFSLSTIHLCLVTMKHLPSSLCIAHHASPMRRQPPYFLPNLTIHTGALIPSPAACHLNVSPLLPYADISITVIIMGRLSIAGVMHACRLPSVEYLSRSGRDRRSSSAWRRVSTSGHTLLEYDALSTLVDELLLLAAEITPNMVEGTPFLHHLKCEIRSL